MFTDQEKLNANESPIGLRISAVLLAALGCLFALFVLMFGLLLSGSVFRRLQSHVVSDNPGYVLNLVLGVVVTAGLTFLCFRAAAALRNARRWAAYVATGFGLLLLLFSAMFLYDSFHPVRQAPDSYFVILIIPFFVAVGLWWCIYLNLPRVRTYLN